MRISQIMDVIVVGCGAAGIAALRKLHDAGLKVLGLEAAERIGGRICTEPFADGVVDIGAAWCHGETDNIVFELANPLGLLGRPKDSDHKYYVLSNGEVIKEDTADEILDAISEEVARADKNNQKSISECVKTAATNNKFLMKNPGLTKSLVEWYERNNQVGGQSNPDDGKSLKGLVEHWPCAGEYMLNWRGRGYKTILDVLLNRYPDPSKEIPVQILLYKEVDSIRWRSSQIDDTENPLVQVKCKDGSMYAAKSVIVTLSVGALKERHNELFYPPLHTERVNAINNIQQAVLDKIYIEFEKPWWPKHPANFSILWRDEDKSKFSKEDKWITEIYGLMTIENQPRVLLAWIYGEGAEQMEFVSEEGVKEGIIKLLDFVFKKKFEVAPVKDILRTKWKKNRFVRGSYSYRSVGTEKYGGDAMELSQPLYHGTNNFPVVCFAGEATSYHRHNSVHGAIESGFREAKRLIDSFSEIKS